MTRNANGRARRLPKAVAAAGLALVTASACSAGTAMVGAQPSVPAVGFGSTASPMPSSSPQTCNTSDASLAPKRAYEGGFSGPLNYAYHFDATRFAKLAKTGLRSRKPFADRS